MFCGAGGHLLLIGALAEPRLTTLKLPTIACSSHPLPLALWPEVALFLPSSEELQRGTGNMAELVECFLVSSLEFHYSATLDGVW